LDQGLRIEVHRTLRKRASYNQLAESNFRYRTFILRRFLLLLILVAVGAFIFVFFVPTGPTSEHFVEILPGSSSRTIAATLEQEGIIRSRYAFDALRLVKHGTLKAGEYRFDHPAPIAEVYDRILRGEVYTRSVTIPEGANLFDIAARMEAAQLGTKEEFLAAAQRDTQMIADLDPSAQSLEGYLFPDTYHFQRRSTPEQQLGTMIRRFRIAATSIGLSSNFRKVTTIASLIERETPVPSERPEVASVFFNRLSKGMPLMTDPAVIYGLQLENRYRGTIYQSDLGYDTPYNTYKHSGLPPGPICNPGVESLKAAISPAHTDYLYFVAETADPSGHSRFANTLEEHAKNVQAYRRAMREANGH
jgi:UPF0755 protein